MSNFLLVDTTRQSATSNAMPISVSYKSCFWVFLLINPYFHTPAMWENHCSMRRGTIKTSELLVKTCSTSSDSKQIFQSLWEAVKWFLLQSFKRESILSYSNFPLAGCSENTCAIILPVQNVLQAWIHYLHHCLHLWFLKTHSLWPWTTFNCP